MSEEKEVLSNTTTITDPGLEPFYITKDAYCYTIMERVTPSFTESTKQYMRSIGHYSNFGLCLKAIAKLKLDANRDYTSVKEYLQEYKQIESSLNQLINIGI